VLLDVFPAVSQRWQNTDLAAAIPQVFGGSADATAVRPYAIVKPMQEVTRSRTNKGRYAEFTFEVHVVAEDFDSASILGSLVQERLVSPPMTFAGSASRFLSCVEGVMRWQEEDQYWIVVVELVVTGARPGLQP
jgi:hypothetical protein